MYSHEVELFRHLSKLSAPTFHFPVTFQSKKKLKKSPWTSIFFFRKKSAKLLQLIIKASSPQHSI